MRSLITILALIFMQLYSLPASADGVFKWKDRYGKTQYGDQPPQGVKAEAVKMPAITVIENYGQQWKSNSVASVEEKDDQPGSNYSRPGYDSLNIIAPKADQAIRANDGDVTLMLDLKPKLQKGHSIVVFLDGKQVSNGPSRAVNLTNLDRGTHQVQAEVRDAHNSSLISSSGVSFTVLRHSILLNKNKTKR